MPEGLVRTDGTGFSDWWGRMGGNDPIQERGADRAWGARLLALLVLGYVLYYLSWRATATLNTQALAFSLVFLLAEAQGAVNLVLFIMMTWDTAARAPFALRPDLRVDVYIPTYSEDPDILEATLVGCAALAYPHTTYVLVLQREMHG